MPELRELLDWALEPVTPAQGGYERVAGRARRHARRQRITAGAVGLAVAVAGIGFGLFVLRGEHAPPPGIGNRLGPRIVEIPATLPASALVPDGWVSANQSESSDHPYVGFAAATSKAVADRLVAGSGIPELRELPAAADDAFVLVAIDASGMRDPVPTKWLVPMVPPDRQAAPSGIAILGTDVLRIPAAIGREGASYTVTYWIGPKASGAVGQQAISLIQDLRLPWADLLESIPVTRQSAVREFPNAGVTLSPPPADLEPEVTAVEALQHSYWSFNPQPGEEISATFALFSTVGSQPAYEEVPVWVVEFRFPCRVSERTPSPSPDCLNDAHLVYDAESGQQIIAWTTGPAWE